MVLMKMLVTRDVTKELSLLWEATKDRKRGEVITYLEIVELTKIKKLEAGWSKMILAWKKKMERELGFHVDALETRGIGFKICNKDDQLINRPERYEKAAMKKLKKAAVCVGSIREEETTDAEKDFQHRRTEQIMTLANTQKKQQIERKSWLAKIETIPVAKTNQQ